jgi:hypothetical protein
MQVFQVIVTDIETREEIEESRLFLKKQSAERAKKLLEKTFNYDKGGVFIGIKRLEVIEG